MHGSDVQGGEIRSKPHFDLPIKRIITVLASNDCRRQTHSHGMRLRKEAFGQVTVQRPPRNTGKDQLRVVYSEPEELDRLLERLRKARSEQPRRESIASPNLAFPSDPEPAPEPAPVPHVEPLRPPAGESAQPAVAPARVTAPPGAAERNDAPAFPHMPRETAERLASVATQARAPAPQKAPQKAQNEPAPLPPTAAAPRSGIGELRQAIEASKSAFFAIGKFSFAINILMLAGPLFMLQVYDRVMTSGSMSTLAALSILTAGVYGVIGLLELVRTRIIVRTGIDLDRRVGDRVFEATIRRALQAPGSAPQALRELDQLRQFVSGPAPQDSSSSPGPATSAHVISWAKRRRPARAAWKWPRPVIAMPKPSLRWACSAPTGRVGRTRSPKP
ncbi:MAG: hypothetical protein R3D68_10095 [Hyphomicrobiaceae bacterium]